MKTKVVHCKQEPYDIYIGRPSPLGNPYSHLPRSRAEIRVASREEAIAKHMELLRSFPEEQLMSILTKLVGKRLGCWCKPKSCHGDNFIILMKEKGLE